MDAVMQRDRATCCAIQIQTNHALFLLSSSDGLSACCRNTARVALQHDTDKQSGYHEEGCDDATISMSHHLVKLRATRY